MLLSIILMSAVALLLSWEYKGEQYRRAILLCRIACVAVAAAAAVGMIVGYTHGVAVALGVVAVGINLPLAVIGLKRK